MLEVDMQTERDPVIGAGPRSRGGMPGPQQPAVLWRRILRAVLVIPWQRPATIMATPSSLRFSLRASDGHTLVRKTKPTNFT